MDEIDIEAYFRDYWDSSSAPNTYEERPEGTGIENRLTREPDLYDHLLWQLHMSDASPATARDLRAPDRQPRPRRLPGREHRRDPPHDRRQRRAALHAESTSSAALAVPAVVRSARRRLPHPAGGSAAPARGARDGRSGARRTGSCATTGTSSCAASSRRWPRRSTSRCATSSPRSTIIRALDTHPGRKYSTERAHYVEPDVMIVKVGDEYIIQLNDDGLPRLQVSKRYRQLLQKWRRREAPVRGAGVHQGEDALGDLADQEPRSAPAHHLQGGGVDRAPAARLPRPRHRPPASRWSCATWPRTSACTSRRSSRVVSNKYIHTPRGLYPMKFFFHSGIDREYGDNISSLTVKRKIQQLIQGEDRAPAALRQRADARAQPRGHQHRPAHGGQVPRRAGDPLLDRPQADLLGASCGYDVRDPRADSGSVGRRARRQSRREADMSLA